jgi:membrane fusion protein (multidrug efflux system)
VNIKAWLLTLLTIFIVVFALFNFKQQSISPEINEEPAYEPAATVSAITAKYIDYQETANVNGIIKAVQTLMLKNELAGKIVELNVNSGEVIEQGQLLLKLDTSTEEADLIAAKAQLKLSEQTITRYKKLIVKKEISADLLDQAVADLAMAKSRLMSLEATIAKKTIKAPFKAIAGLHNLSIGQYLDNNTSIVELTSMSAVSWLEFSLPQTFPELALSQTITFKKVEYEKNAITAKIIALNPTLAEQSRHLKYRAQFSNETLLLKPNTLVKVTAPVTKMQQTLVIPDIAVVHDQFGDYVYVLSPQEDGSYRAKRTQIFLKQKQQGQVFIATGIELNQIVATDGAFKLRDGMKVFIAPDNLTAQ